MARRMASVGVPVEPPEPRAVAPARRVRPPDTARRLVAVHDTDGPRVRLGLVWFAAALLGLLLGRAAVALLMGGAAALAAGELVAVRARDGRSAGEPLRRALEPAAWLDPPMRLPAALVALAVPLAAGAGTATLTAAIAVAVPVVAVYRLTVPGAVGATADAGYGLACGAAVGIAAAAPVLAYGVGPDVALVLVVLVSAYDAGDYIVGSGASSAWEGPAAGIAAVLVLTFAATVVPPAPLDSGDVWLLGALACLLAPIGPPAASVLLGSGDVRAGYVRRIDSLLVLGPVWAYAAAAIA